MLEHVTNDKSERIKQQPHIEMLTGQQQRHLQEIEAGFKNEKLPDGTNRWCRLFESGVRDADNGVWAFWKDRTRDEKEGWQVWYCEPKSNEFNWISLDDVVVSKVPAMAGQPAYETAQLIFSSDQQDESSINDRITIYADVDKRWSAVHRFGDERVMDTIPTPATKKLGEVALAELPTVDGYARAA